MAKCPNNHYGSTCTCLHGLSTHRLKIRFEQMVYAQCNSFHAHFLSDQMNKGADMSMPAVNIAIDGLWRGRHGRG